MLQKFSSAAVLEAALAPHADDVKGLRRFAHRHHFDYEPRPDFLYVRSRAISSRCNDNYDEFPAEEIKTAYKTFVGKPVFVNHNNDDHRRARGVIIDAALHEDRNPDGSPDTWVEVLMEVDAKRFPRLAKAILAGHIDRTSMGTDVAFSKCSFCGNTATTPMEYCQHIPRMKGQRIYRTTANGSKEGVLIREICHGLKFFENSLLVEPPADPTAFFLGVEDGSKIARKTAMEDPEFSLHHDPDALQHHLFVDHGVETGTDPANMSPASKSQLWDRHQVEQQRRPTDRVKHFDHTTNTWDEGETDWHGHRIESESKVAGYDMYGEWDGRDDDDQEENDHDPMGHQNWDKVYHDLPEHVHRGIGVHLPKDVHDYVHNQSMPTEDRAHALLKHLHGPRSDNDWREGLGTSWSGDEGTAEDFAHENARRKDQGLGEHDHPPTAVTFHAHRPERDSIDDNPNGDGSGMRYTYHGHGEREVPVHGGSEMKLHSMTWTPVPHVMHPSYVSDDLGSSHHVFEKGRSAYSSIGRFGSLMQLFKQAYGETMAPPDVDTLRDEECPVCQEKDSYDGNECQVCGFVQPPKMFRDPDLDLAKEIDLRKDIAEEQNPDAKGIPAGPDANDPNAPPGDQGNPDGQPGPGQEQTGIQDNVPGEEDQAPIDPTSLDENGKPIVPGGEVSEMGQPALGPDGQPLDPNAPIDPSMIGPDGQPIDPNMVPPHGGADMPPGTPDQGETVQTGPDGDPIIKGQDALPGQDPMEPDELDQNGMPIAPQDKPNADAQDIIEDENSPLRQGDDGLVHLETPEPKDDQGTDDLVNDPGEPSKVMPRQMEPGEIEDIYGQPLGQEGPLDAEERAENGLSGPEDNMPGDEAGGAPQFAPDGQMYDPAQEGDQTAQLECPNCGEEFDTAPPTSVTTDAPEGTPDGIVAGDVCPNCGQALLVTQGQEGAPGEDGEEEEELPPGNSENPASANPFPKKSFVDLFR